VPLAAVALVAWGALAAGRNRLGIGVLAATLVALHAIGTAPLGLSFALFQAIALVADAPRLGTPGLARTLAFISFFPSLFAGPIERPAALLPRLAAPDAPQPEALARALTLIARGIIWKYAISDVIAPATLGALASPHPTGPIAWTAAACHGFRIYADLQAWTHIARGLAGLVGVALPDNFDQPFRAPDPAAFWRRWHVTVSAWFRDRVLAPLIGPHPTDLRAASAVVIVFALVGLWHGLSANHLLFGLWHALWVIAAIGWRRGHAPGPLSPVLTWIALVPAVFFLVDPTPGAVVAHWTARWTLAPAGLDVLRGLIAPTALGIGWGLATFAADRLATPIVWRWPARAATWSLAAAIAVALPAPGGTDFLYFRL
jgi:D-alanyl-lipoteichoic acid acyltransferase DltB (MBOAT superfamily)